jgi:DUF1680 family protein
LDLLLPENVSFKTIDYKILDEPVIAIQADLPAATPINEGTAVAIGKRKITAIPYYCWANRGPHPMQVWLPVRIKQIKIN